MTARTILDEVPSLWQEIHYSFRLMRSNPAFTAVIVLTLALGIGANTAILSVANAVLFEPLPYPSPERLMWLTNYDQRFKQEAVAGPDYFDWRSQTRSFDAMMGYEYWDQNLVVNANGGQVPVATILGDFWTIMGAHPRLGRAFRPGEPHVIVLGYQLFQQRFKGDPHIIGKSVTLDGNPATVIGVMPKDFLFLFPTEGVYAPTLASRTIEAYVPSTLSAASQTRSGGMTPLSVIGRRKPETSVSQARAELEALQMRVAVQNPAFYGRLKLRVLPLHDKLVEGTRPALLVLLAAVGFVLLIACANVANLLLARATARQKEVSIRLALGAPRFRVMRQFLTESLILALMGGAAGLFLARWGVALLVHLGPSDVPRLEQAAINGAVLGFTFVVSLITGLLFSVAPAFSFSKSSLHDLLKESGRTLSASSAARRLRGLLAVGELALALVLLSGAGLMVRSFWRMNATTPGFDPGRILVMRVSLSGPRYRAEQAQIAYAQEVLRRLEGAPGVVSTGISGMRFQTVVNFEGEPLFPLGQGPLAAFHTASAGYLHVMGMRLVKGRWITDTEPANVVMVNEAFARRLLGGEEPVGKRIRVLRPLSGPDAPPSWAPATIVGMIADLKYAKLDADPEPEVYVPYQLSPFIQSVEVVTRTTRDPRSVAPDLRKLISDIDRSQPIYDVKTLEQVLSDSITPRRFNMLLLGIFAGIALVLAAVGTYGVMSCTVVQRTREIGVRMALGAQQHELVWMVVKQGMALAIAGIGIGLGAALWLTPLIASLLYDVKATDLKTFAVVCVVLAAVAFLACWIPARKAANVDPVVALRNE